MLTDQQVLDRYFPEVRAKLIEIAATMDRLQRAHADSPQLSLSEDDRMKMFYESLQVLKDTSDAPDKAERIQMIFSDPHPLPND